MRHIHGKVKKMAKKGRKRKIHWRTRKGIWHVRRRLILFSRLVSQAETILQHIFSLFLVGEAKKQRSKEREEKVSDG